YDLVKENYNAFIDENISTFPACSVAGVPGVKKWYCAIQSICGLYQFCSSDWKEVNCDASQTFLKNIAMVDVILLSAERDAPKLKDCLCVIGALKHLREWHFAKITIVANESKSWQRYAHYLSADVVPSDNLKNIIDSKELWRGRIQIWERKFASEVKFPEFCIKGTSAKPFSTLHLNTCSTTKKTVQSKNSNILPEVFHYYGAAMEFVQMVILSDLPSYFVSDLEFELGPLAVCKQNKSWAWLKLSILSLQVGALFVLPCSVSNVLIPLPSQLSTKKWKEYMARNPTVITVPEVELKVESCCYYLLVQGNGSRGCKATLIYSANQINGTAAIAVINGKLKRKTEEKETSTFPADFISSLPNVYGEQILQREKKLAFAQTFALKECLKRQESVRQPPAVSVDELKTLFTLTRERILELPHASLAENVRQKAADKAALYLISLSWCGNSLTFFLFFSELEFIGSNPLEWPERNVLQSLENLEKAKQKTRAYLFLGQRFSISCLDAPECLGNVENAFLLTPELTLPKLRGLPFEKAARCHYHGLEYCLDNRKALERDVAFAELQTRLIRYETQTTCTKECCPVPCVLSPLPSPAVLSESGSIPDGETLQSELRTEASRLKRRSKDQDCFYPKKRLTKTESTDSLLSQASGSSGSYHSVAVTRAHPERSVPVTSASVKHLPSQLHKVTTKAGPASRRSASETSNPVKESRSQKHTRMLKEVVTKTLQKHGIAEDHGCFTPCSQRLFEISKFYLKDLKTSRGLFDEMKKTANNNAKQVIEWVLEKTNRK
uniref:MDM2 binding protein n=1 Tax=Sphenodon punctatus TaxID=8508 RepID=A0A8D0GW48_SPHPU